jgi:diaminopimelate decarboxylase
MTNLSYHGNQLYFGRNTITALADELGTPVFVVDEVQLQSNFKSLTAGMVSSGVQPLIRYCAKTNNEAHVLGVMASLGSHVMVSHQAEAELALRCGFSPDKVSYQRPVFLENEVRSILEKGVSLIHIYRYQDIPKITTLATELKI